MTNAELQTKMKDADFEAGYVQCIRDIVNLYIKKYDAMSIDEAVDKLPDLLKDYFKERLEKSHDTMEIDRSDCEQKIENLSLYKARTTSIRDTVTHILDDLK